MTAKGWFPAALAAMLVASPVIADDTGFFVGGSVFAEKTFGSSSSTTGGALWGGGGIVDNVRFGTGAGGGLQAGYRFDDARAVFVSYDYSRSDVRWDAAFPLLGPSVISSFDGTAVSNALMGNFAYDFALSEATHLQASVGAGLSLNTLLKIRETVFNNGGFISNLENHTQISPVAQLGSSLTHHITPGITLSLNASASYARGFETGNSRSDNVVTTDITPYEIENIWRTKVGTALRFAF